MDRRRLNDRAAGRDQQVPALRLRQPAERAGILAGAQARDQRQLPLDDGQVQRRRQQRQPRPVERDSGAR